MCYIHEGKCKTTINDPKPPPKAKPAKATKPKAAKATKPRTKATKSRAKATKPRTKATKSRAKAVPKAKQSDWEREKEWWEKFARETRQREKEWWEKFPRSSQREEQKSKAVPKANTVGRIPTIFSTSDEQLLKDIQNYNEKIRRERRMLGGVYGGAEYSLPDCQNMLKDYETLWKRLDPLNAKIISTKADLTLFKRRMSIIFHPDNHPENKRAWATSMMAELNRVVEACSNFF
jgi:hypothetical protein